MVGPVAPRPFVPFPGLPAGDEMAFDHVGDGTLRLRKARADHAKRPATGYGARPSWAMNPSMSKSGNNYLHP